MRRNLADLSDRAIGRLTVIQSAMIAGRTKWLCVCECGELSVTAGYSLLNGDTRSCGASACRPKTRIYVKGANDVRVTNGAAFIDISTPSHPHAVAIIDEGDVPIVLDGLGRWSAHRTAGSSLYAHRTRRDSSPRTAEQLHRFILGLPGGRTPIVDHRDGNGLNNSRLNLRMTNSLGNGANAVHGRGSSRFKGVFRRNDRWRAGIMANRQMHWLGTFESEEMAARAYDVAALELHREFAVLNFGGRNVV